ncbi:hypothetical protein ACYULU_15665 [Breznakiellaceae bacterium SP9]
MKQGRKLAAVRFDCKQTARTVSKKGRKKADAAVPTLPETSLNTAGMRKEKELEHLAELYPEEFTALYEEELAKPSFLPPDSLFRQTTAKAVAVIRLREKYGIVK